MQQIRGKSNIITDFGKTENALPVRKESFFVFLHKSKKILKAILWKVMKFQKTFDIHRWTRYNMFIFIRDSITIYCE